MYHKYKVYCPREVCSTTDSTDIKRHKMLKEIHKNSREFFSKRWLEKVQTQVNNMSPPITHTFVKPDFDHVHSSYWVKKITLVAERLATRSRKLAP